MRLIIAADPFGHSLAESLVEHLRSTRPDIHIVDTGLWQKYYEAAHAVGGLVELAAAEAAAGGSASAPPTRAILCCGSGQGMCIIANKYPHVSAALCTTPEAAAGSRSVNNSNVLCLGGRVSSADEGRRMVDAWLGAELGQGWEPPIQDFIRSSLPATAALSFSPQAAAAAARAVQEKLQAAEAAGGGGGEGPA